MIPTQSDPSEFRPKTHVNPTSHPILNVPQDYNERQKLQKYATEYVAKNNLIPPLGLDELKQHSRNLHEQYAIANDYTGWLMVILNNELWKPQIQKIPYTERILLLPQCLRNPQLCHAQIDSVGLLCEQCGCCAIAHLLEKAENLGYTTLVAEGATVVASLLRQGSITAVIGVGCLAALEKSFADWANQGIPGIAIPLYKDGCRETQVDVSWIESALEIPYIPSPLFHLQTLQQQVACWFEKQFLANILGPAHDITQQIAQDWLVKAGKRWRPLLVTAVYHALQVAEMAENQTDLSRAENQTDLSRAENQTDLNLPDMIARLAVAVECFHKASLIHDDIEDGDTTRYGMPTLHIQYGIPIALNVGDFLLSEGYRLIAQCGENPQTTLIMLQIAIQGHRHLCLGQGQELAWRQQITTVFSNDTAPPLTTSGPVQPLAMPQHAPPLTTSEPAQPLITHLELLDMFSKKTAPGFDVALQLGAIAGHAPPNILAMLHEFSIALGIVYQIHDDQQDRPTFIPNSVLQQFPILLQEYHDKALTILQSCRYPDLKIFLHRLLAKVLE